MKIRLVRTRGTKFFCLGHNEYGYWIVVNVIPGKFGLCVDVDKEQTNDLNE